MRNDIRTKKVEEVSKKIIFSQEEINSRVKQVGQQITKDFADKEKDGIVVVSILKGAAIFMTDLIMNINLNVEIDFMCVSSYNESTKSSGKCVFEKDLTSDVEGKHIIIAEDVIDSGLTLYEVINHLKNSGAASVTVCALLHKHIAQKDIDVDYICFDCPSDYIVGYGLDYAHLFRNVPYIFALKEEYYND